MNSSVFSLHNVDKTKVQIAGGKGANLGELTRIEGISVPDGFCISTEAFGKVLMENGRVNELLHQLSMLTGEERDKIAALSSDIRQAIEATPIPQPVDDDIN